MAEETAVTEEKKEKKTTEKVEVPKEFATLVEHLDKMSALEISKFVKFLEEYWGVSSRRSGSRAGGSGRWR